MEDFPADERDFPMDEGEDTDEFEDIENEDENDPDDLYERTLEVRQIL